jgi:hypothetical protein
MEWKAKRTLVKSAPELWELADDPGRMEAWIAGLAGTSQPMSVEVTDRQPERILAWRTTGAGGTDVRMALQLVEKGFGTAVSLSAVHSRPDLGDVDAALEQLLDELGSPERRPFERA